MIESKFRKTTLLLSSIAMLGAGIGMAYARGSGGFPYERFGDDLAGSPGLNQMTPDQLAAGGGGSGGGAAGASSGAGSGTGSGAAPGSSSGSSVGSSSTGGSSSGMTGTGGSSSGQ